MNRSIVFLNLYFFLFGFLTLSAASVIETTPDFSKEYPGISLTVNSALTEIKVFDSQEIKVTPIAGLSENEQSTVLCAVYYRGCSFFGDRVIDRFFRLSNLPPSSIDWGMSLYSMDLDRAGKYGRIRFVTVFQLVVSDERKDALQLKWNALKESAIAQVVRFRPELNQANVQVHQGSFLKEANAIITQLNWIPQDQNLERFNCVVPEDGSGPRCVLQVDYVEPPVGGNHGWAEALANDLIRKGALQTLSVKIQLKPSSDMAPLENIALSVPLKNIDVVPLNSSFTKLSPHSLPKDVSND